MRSGGAGGGCLNDNNDDNNDNDDNNTNINNNNNDTIILMIVRVGKSPAQGVRLVCLLGRPKHANMRPEPQRGKLVETDLVVFATQHVTISCGVLPYTS